MGLLFEVTHSILNVINLEEGWGENGNITHLVRIDIGRQWRIVTLLYLLTEGVKVHLVTIEWRLQGSHFIQQAAEGPDV